MAELTFRQKKQNLRLSVTC